MIVTTTEDLPRIDAVQAGSSVSTKKLAARRFSVTADPTLGEVALSGCSNPGYEIEPWTPADSVAWLKAMAWDLRDNIETETERALAAADFSSAQVAELYPAYPYDRNPVIVPEISSVPVAGTVGS